MGMAGGAVSQKVVLLAGLAGLLAGAFSMGAGEYISMTSQREIFEREIALEADEVPRALPDQGADGHPVYRIPVEKFRRGPRLHFETRNVADDGAASKGRLITEALEATRFARAVVEELAPRTDLLVVWRGAKRGQPRRELDRHPPVGKFRFGIDSLTGTKWGRDFGLGGSPFQRGRRTVLVVDRRAPAQHSQDTHDRSYALVDKRVRAEAGPVIADGAHGAVEHARRAVLEARLVAGPLPGDVPTAIADCEDLTAARSRHPAAAAPRRS